MDGKTSLPRNMDIENMGGIKSNSLIPRPQIFNPHLREIIANYFGLLLLFSFFNLPKYISAMLASNLLKFTYTLTRSSANLLASISTFRRSSLTVLLAAALSLVAARSALYDISASGITRVVSTSYDNGKVRAYSTI